jgi:hypothetical protein
VNWCRLCHGITFTGFTFFLRKKKSKQEGEEEIKEKKKEGCNFIREKTSFFSKKNCDDDINIKLLLN